MMHASKLSAVTALLLVGACGKPVSFGPAPEAPKATVPPMPVASGSGAGDTSADPASGGGSGSPALPSPATPASLQAGPPGPSPNRRAPAPPGSTFYVAPTGSGTGCSRAAPCREIADALAHARPGDAVFVADGTYRPFTIRGLRGSTGAPLIVYAQGEHANVSPGAKDSILIENSFYVTLDGLNAGSAPRAGVGVLCSNHVTIRNGRYVANGKWGIFSGYADDLTVDHNETSGSRTQHGIYAANSADRPIIHGNLVRDNAQGGIQINADGTEKPDADCAWATAGGVADGICTGALIEDNLISGNGAKGGAAINLDGVQSSIVRNNFLSENHASGITNFKEDGTEGPRGMEILGNTVLQAAGSRNGLQFLVTTGMNRVRDNVLYHPDARRGGLEVGNTGDIANLDADYDALDRVALGDDIVPLADFQATYKKELHAVAGATPERSYVGGGGKAYSLLPGSPLSGKGVFEPHAARDATGKPRPQTTPDIGSLQH